MEKPRSSRRARGVKAPRVVVIGSYREDLGGLLALSRRLEERGCEVLHPSHSARYVEEEQGFVRLDCDVAREPAVVQRHVFSLMAQADAVMLYIPTGRVGVSAALEIGYALALGKPVYATHPPEDATLRGLVSSPEESRRALGSFAPSVEGAAGHDE